VRVLIVTQYFQPESFRINDLAIGLRDRGHKVTVLTGLPNYPGGQFFSGYHWFSKGEVWEGITIKRVPVIPRGKSRKIQLVLNYLSFAIFAGLLGPVRCRGNFDVIFVFEPSPITVGLPAMMMKWLRKAPILFWVQDPWPEVLSATGAVKSRWILWSVDRLVRMIYRSCDRILVQSQGFTSHVVSRNIPSERVVYFPNWAESFFRPVELPSHAAEFDEMPDGFRIMFAGNIGVGQSFETILEAAQLTRDQPEIKWIILGDGRQRDWVEQEVKSRGLSQTVHLLGRRPLETMPRYYATADALLCTLKQEPVFAKTIPSKLQSYLACGRPLLASLDGEGAEVVTQSGSGLVCPAENAEELAKLARKLFACSSQERKQMGQNGRAYYERNFDRELLLDRLERLMNDVTGRIPLQNQQKDQQTVETQQQCAA